MQYVLMRKNQPITVTDISEEGRMLWYSREQLEKNSEIAPLWENSSKNSLISWWENRAIPISQKKIKEAYEKKIDLYRRYQLGQDLKMIKFPQYNPEALQKTKTEDILPKGPKL